MQKDLLTISWKNFERNPILDLGPVGSIDELFSSWGSLVYHDGLYYLYYSARDSKGIVRICLATSSDGRDFEKYGGNPILDVGSEGSWDASYVYCPVVWKDNDKKYKMIFTGCDKYLGSSHYQIGLAKSDNGRDWEKSGYNPIFNDKNRLFKNHWKKHETEAWGFFRDQTGYYLLYNAVSKKPRQIFIAHSSNLFDWKPMSKKPILASEGTKGELGYMKYCACISKWRDWFYIASAVSNEDYSKSAIGLWKLEGLSPTSDKAFLGYILGTTDDWNRAELDTPFLVPRKSDAPLFDCYYSGRSLQNKWTLGVATGILDVM